MYNWGCVSFKDFCMKINLLLLAMFVIIFFPNFETDNEYCEAEAGWAKNTEAYPELPKTSMLAISPELLL